MIILLYVAAFLFVFGLFSFLLFLLVIAIDSAVLGHDLPTSKKAAKNIEKIILQHKAYGNFYDLGCARGALAIHIKDRFPILSVSAIDNNPIRILFARIRASISGSSIRFVHKNIFDVNLSDADIIYTYLWYDVMPPLEKKLLKELKQGAIVITNTSHFPTWKPLQRVATHQETSKMPDFETLFVYKKQ